MPYSDFTIPDVIQRLGLTVTQVADLFGVVPPADLPGGLGETLRRYLPLALDQNTEKGRSELLVAPMLAELKLRHADRLSVFSGVTFDVDPADGLAGRCDFLVSRSPLQLAVVAPVCVLVQAKNENIVAGIPQCLAEMVAAQRFNAAAGRDVGPIYGAVTTGLAWRFLRLDGTRASVDGVEYPIQVPERVFGVLTYMALGASEP